MTLYISDSFSLTMLSKTYPYYDLLVEPLGDVSEIKDILLRYREGDFDDEQTVVYAIGVEDTARIVSRDLDEDIKPSRDTVILKPNDFLIVVQYQGPPEFVEYWLIRIE